MISSYLNFDGFSKGGFLEPMSQESARMEKIHDLMSPAGIVD